MAKLITEELIDLALEGSNKVEVIRALATKIYESDRLGNYEGYVANVIKREELTTTGIGFGIAIPHGKCSHVKQPTIAFGRLTEDIDWESLDGKKVGLVFLLAVPEDCKGETHLKLIASLSRKLIHEEFRKALHTVTSPEDIVKLLSEDLAAAVA